MTVDKQHTKSFRRWVTGFVAALVVGLLGSTAFVSLAHAAGTGGGDSPLVKAQSDQELEDAYRQIVSKGPYRWPNTFGQAWAKGGDPENGIFVSFSKNPKGRVAKLAEDFPRPELLIPVKIKHSLNALVKFQDRIGWAGSRASRGLPPLGHATNGWFSSDLDIRNGVVVLGFPKITKRIRATFRVVSRSKAIGIRMFETGIGIRMFETGYIRDDVETGRDWEVRLKKVNRKLLQTRKVFKRAKAKQADGQVRKLKRRIAKQRLRKQKLRRKMLGLPWPVQPVRR